MKKILIYMSAICSCIILCRCNRRIDKEVNWNVPVKSDQKIQFFTFTIDTLQLDSVSTSYEGSLHVWKNKIVFVDHKFCWFFIFDSSGRFISQKIGQGSKANELPCKKISNYIPMVDGGHMFLGPSWDVYIFDSNFVKKADFLINWHPRGNKEYIAQHPDPSDPIMYSITYGIQPIRADKFSVTLPIFSQHKLFFPATDEYAKKSRIMARLDIKHGEVTEIYGRLSPIYIKNANIRTFPYPIYDLSSENEMVVGFPVDSLIYVSDKDFNIHRAFGRMGRDMDTNYQCTMEYDKFSRQWTKENKRRGYYNGIDIIKPNVIIRTYYKGGMSKTSGLQLYNNGVLIADVDVPVNAKFIGYIAPYIYLSSGPQEDESRIKVFRFKPGI